MISWCNISFIKDVEDIDWQSLLSFYTAWRLVGYRLRSYCRDPRFLGVSIEDVRFEIVAN
jgi:hypothetical protein